MKEKLVEVDLSIDVIEEYAMATLRFTNFDEENIYLNHHAIIYEGDDYVHCFKIIDEDEVKIVYCDICKTRSLDPEYSITVEPKATLEFGITLNGLYQFKKGNRHIVQYLTISPDRLGDQQLTASNFVEMVIK